MTKKTMKTGKRGRAKKKDRVAGDKKRKVMEVGSVHGKELAQQEEKRKRIYDNNQ